MNVVKPFFAPSTSLPFEKLSPKLFHQTLPIQFGLDKQETPPSDNEPPSINSWQAWVGIIGIAVLSFIFTTWSDNKKAEACAKAMDRPDMTLPSTAQCEEVDGDGVLYLSIPPLKKK